MLNSTTTLPPEIYLGSLSVAKQWCRYSPKTFLIHEEFIATIMRLLTSYPSLEIFKKVINLQKKLLTSSSHAKLLGNIRLD